MGSSAMRVVLIGAAAVALAWSVYALVQGFMALAEMEAALHALRVGAETARGLQ